MVEQRLAAHFEMVEQRLAAFDARILSNDKGVQELFAEVRASLAERPAYTKVLDARLGSISAQCSAVKKECEMLEDRVLIAERHLAKACAEMVVVSTPSSQQRMPSTPSSPQRMPLSQDLSTEDLRRAVSSTRLRQTFDQCDEGGHGLVHKAQFLRKLRQQPEVSRHLDEDFVERIERIDTGSSSCVSWKALEALFPRPGGEDGGSPPQNGHAATSGWSVTDEKSYKEPQATKKSSGRASPMGSPKSPPTRHSLSGASPARKSSVSPRSPPGSHSSGVQKTRPRTSSTAVRKGSWA